MPMQGESVSFLQYFNPSPIHHGKRSNLHVTISVMTAICLKKKKAVPTYFMDKESAFFINRFRKKMRKVS